MSYEHAYYLGPVIQPEHMFDTTTEAAARLQELSVDFDTIVFRGVSGCLFGIPLAHKLGKNMIVVRKGENNHSGRLCEGHSGVKRYIIVDDLVDTGKTVRYIVGAVKAFADKPAVCIGVFCYYEHKGRLRDVSEWVDEEPVKPVKTLAQRPMQEDYPRRKVRKP